MSILTATTSLSVTPPSREKILEIIAKRITEFSLKSFTELVKIQKDGNDMVWNNRGFKPQEIIDALGDNAIKIYNYHGALTQYLVTISALDGVEYTPALPSYAYTITDGKFTVLDTPYVP
jgi:hypothetical protein